MLRFTQENTQNCGNHANRQKKSFVFFWEKIETNLWVESIRNGMILAIPAVMTGSIAVLLNNIPIAGYTRFISEFCGGIFKLLFTAASSVTLSSMSLFLLLTISYSVAENKKSVARELVPIAVLCSYMAFCSDINKGVSLEIFQNTWLAVAIVFSLVFSSLFIRLSNFCVSRSNKYATSDSFLLNKALANIFPVLILLAIALLLRLFIWLLFGKIDFQNFISQYWIDVFQKRGRNLSGALLFSFLNQLFWFFGIHGSNVLDAAAKELFEAGIIINGALAAAGQPPAEIISKTFLDVFVFMGGCGSTLCLVGAVLFFSRKNYIRGLTNFAIIPALFNINEIVLFGFPLVLNPVFLLPFVAVPCLLTAVSYAAMNWGLVPLPVQSVGWTVPVFFSGYAATGSIRGSFLQLFNLLLGMGMYLPFVLYYQKIFSEAKRRKIGIMTDYVQECEKDGSIPDFMEMSMASVVANELVHDVEEDLIEVFYQPQHDYEGSPFGAEALLRWNINDVGYVYPPLVIALSEFAKCSAELDKCILNKICSDIEVYKQNGGAPLEFSFNISFSRLSSFDLLEMLETTLKKYDLGKNTLCLEITEQAVFQSSPFIIDRLEKIRRMGIRLAMDDFGMGHTSLVHLTDNSFDMVKLDGSLTRGLTKNPRCADIILSIVGLSRSMGFDVVAEYVETQELKERLHELGCDKYQGYLYARPLPVNEFMARYTEFESRFT